MELDIEDRPALLAYLSQASRVAAGERPRTTVLRGGVSNRAVLVEWPSGEAWVLKQALAKLRVPVDWFSSPGRIAREALGMRWLAQLLPPGAVPELVFEDPERHLLAMTAVPAPHENWKTMLLAGRIAAGHVEQFAALLAAIHRGGWQRRAKLEPVFFDRSYFESLRLEPYYEFTARQVPPAAAFLGQLVESTRATGLTLVHGDFSPKNILVHAGRLVLLDHEVIHFGDPAFDLGFSLTHLLSKAHHVAAARAAFASAARRYWRCYRECLGALDWAGELEARAARHTLGCLLARVAGRSPLEYLDEEERRRQREAVVALTVHVPTAVPAVIDEFLERIS